MKVVASLSQGRTAAAQCGLFTHKSVPVIFEPPCSSVQCFTPTNEVRLTKRQQINCISAEYFGVNGQQTPCRQGTQLLVFCTVDATSNNTFHCANRAIIIQVQLLKVFYNIQCSVSNIQL